ncbi:helix-turn-helix domain-containing protein [Nonomuraea sp. NPDC049400]|uniref:helix-turn-helix domain-containing protein n=1 Tax=Nonomuraea sp. NPDC049400 TaxID=3364352 RepID=UPI0037B95BD8
MKWNLRITAAHRGIWKASELQRLLAAHGLKISAGKMSGLWSGTPASVKLDELDVICVVLGCDLNELMSPEPDKVTRPGTEQEDQPATAVAAEGRRTITPKARRDRSMPPR